MRRRVHVQADDVLDLLGECRVVGAFEGAEARLYTNRGTKRGHRRHVEPDWAMLHRELKRKHVTLSILWDE